MKVTKKQMVQLREQLRQTVDDLPDGAVRGLIRLLQDNRLRSLINTPDGETPLNPYKLAGILEGLRDGDEGRVYKFESAKEAVAWLNQHPAPDPER